MNAANGHAGVGSFHHDRYAASLEFFVEKVGNLLGESFLELGLMSEGINDASEFGDANNSLIGQVSHMGVAQERQQVMLADRVKGNVPQTNDLVVIFLEILSEMLSGIGVCTME